jgi:hypothetical protein
MIKVGDTVVLEDYLWFYHHRGTPGSELTVFQNKAIQKDRYPYVLYWNNMPDRNERRELRDSDFVLYGIKLKESSLIEDWRL